MSEQTSSTQITATEQEAQKTTTVGDNILKMLPLIMATITLLGAMAHYNEEQNNRFAELRQADALIAVRVNNAEANIKSLTDAQALRTTEWQSVQTSLATVNANVSAIRDRLDRSETQKP